MAQNYEGAAECCINDSETLNAAKLRAKQLAEKDVRKKVGDYIKDFSKKRNFTFAEEELATMIDSVLKFTGVQYGKAIIRANVTAQLDDNDILDWLNKYSQEKTALVAQNEELKRRITELEQKLSKYESQPPKINSNSVPNQTVSNSKMDKAWRLFCARDYKGAIKFYDEIIPFIPTSPKPYFYRGRCYQELGYKVKAQADFARAKELSWSR